MIEELQSLIGIPSISEKGDDHAPYGVETAKALKYVLDLCRDFGFRTENCENQAGYAEIGSGDEMIGILCHLDVVPAGNGWTYPPFAGEIHDGRLYGRGAVDDKGPAIACIFAMKELLETGIPLKKRIRIIFGQSEETGDWTDMEYYKQHEELPGYGFTPDADFPVIYGEKGILQIKLSMEQQKSGFLAVSGGYAPNVVADQASCTVLGAGGEKMQFQANGKAAHGSTPEEGENAISKLMELLQKERDIKDFKCPFAEFYMDKIGFALHGEQIDCELSDEASGKITFNAGMIEVREGNVELSVDIRYPVTCSEKEVISRIKEQTEAYGVKVSVSESMAPVYLDKETPVIRALMEVYQEETGDDTPAMTMGGGTYARAMEGIVAFGPLFPGRECTEHQKDEYILLEDLEKAKEIYKKALYRLVEL